MTKVYIIKSERGSGQRVDEVKEFPTREEAEQFCREYNRKHNPPLEETPDWYMYAKLERKKPQCPECGSESIITDHKSDDGNCLRICLDCDRGWTDWQQARIEELQKEVDRLKGLLKEIEDPDLECFDCNNCAAATIARRGA